MAEEGSLMFQVENSEIDSEEEDELLRKQELQKLLSEELQEDLLDTSEEEDNCDLTCGSCEQSTVFNSLPSQLPLDYNSSPLTSHNLAQINRQGHFIQNDVNDNPQIQFRSENEQLFEDHVLPPQLPVEMPCPTDEESNVFNGTSQEYSLLNEHREQSNGIVQLGSASNKDGNFFSELSHLNRQHLEALYVAKNRQIKELEMEVKRVINEDEQKCGILRHKVKLLEDEKESLASKSDQFQTDLELLGARVKEYEQQQEYNKEIMNEQEELREQLSSSQTTINFLTTQLNEMSSTDVLQKIRQNYESQIERSNIEHKKQSQILENRILTLEGELHEMQIKNDKLVQELESSHCTADRCEGVLEMREEKKQLVAEIEDLTFQLNMVQEDLNVSQGKIEQLERALHDVEESQQNMVRERVDEEERLKDALEKLQDELSSQKVIAETNLKKSLEHCRNACLKLHEDSTLILKQEFFAEKEKTESQYKNEINRLRQNIGKDKEKLRKEREEMLQKQIDAALLSAHSVWKEDEQKRVKVQMQSLLKQANRDNEKKLTDALTKKEVDWVVKYNKLANQADNSRQKSETEIAQLKKALSEAIASKSCQKNEKLVSELNSVFKSLQNAMIELMSQTLVTFEEEKNKQLKETRQLALKEAETHYLMCLHALVNNKQ